MIHSAILSRPLDKLEAIKEEELELEVQYGHDGTYYLRDIEYIIRQIRKISKDLPHRKKDIDWLQSHIESFLLLNSRFYEDLIIDLVKEVRKYHLLPNNFSVKSILKKHNDSLSAQYHAEKQAKRNRAAHGSNYQRVGIPEFGNDVLPKPIRYRFTLRPPLFNMASRKDFINMWQADMLECADNIEAMLRDVVSTLNTFKDSPLIEQEGTWKVREGVDGTKIIHDMKELNEKYEKIRPMKDMTQLEALELMISHHEAVEALLNKYFDRTDNTE